MMRSRTHRVVTSRSALVTAVLTVGMVAGCTSSTSGSAKQTITGSGTAPSTVSSTPSVDGSSQSVVTTQPPATHASTVATGRAPVPACLSDIRVIPGTPQGAAGHVALVLVFNNVSTTNTCQIFGYPGVDLVNASGAPVAHLVRTLRGMAGGAPAADTGPRGVVLAPGQSASALAEASTVPQGGIADCGSYSLLITVPNQTVSVPGGTAMLPRCDAQIHPVVPGTTGGVR